MDQTFTCVLLLLSLAGTSSKYVFIQEGKYWPDAQNHCRQFYTDLAPISNEYDLYRLRQIAGDIDVYIWIGMKKSSTDSEEWIWSGGGRVSKFFWDEGQPQVDRNEDYGVMLLYRWHDSTPNHFDPFFCYNVIVVREKKTWEEALNYCREHHRDLASVASETEMMLIQRELKEDVTTRHVWIGLHFFSGYWLWVDRQPLAYEAWGRGGKPECPEFMLECVALNVTGETVETEAAGANTGADAVGVSVAAVDVAEGEWEAHDCEERLHFVCY